MKKTPDQIARYQPLIEAARQHQPVKESVLPWACHTGDCEPEDGHKVDGECPPEDVTVCVACYALASSIDEEVVPDEVLAENCPVCSAVMALDEA